MHPDQKFTSLLSRMSKGWSVIGSFRQVAFAGMQTGTNAVKAQHQAFAQSLANTGQLARLIIGFDAQSDPQEAVQWVTNQLTALVVGDRASKLTARSLRVRVGN